MHPFWVLMWKHMKVRMRRYISTIFELVSTVPLILLMFLLRTQITSIQTTVQEMNKNLAAMSGYIPDSLDVTDRFHQPINVFYTPDTLQTRQIMDIAGPKLGLKRIDSLPAPGKNIYKSYLGLNDESELEEYLKDMSDEEAVVIFELPPQSSNNSEPPRKLTYTIRMKLNFQTVTVQNVDDNVQQHPEYGSIYSTFLGLQWAIDSSYIEYLTNEKVNQRVTYQEIPALNIELKSEGGVSLAGTFLSLGGGFMSPLIVFTFFMARLLEERSTGVQELIKMAGVSNEVIGLAHFVNTLPPGIVFVLVWTVLSVASDTPLIRYTNFVYIFVLWTLLFLFVLALAFAASHLVNSTNQPASLSALVYVVCWSPATYIYSRVTDKERGLMYASGALPFIPVQWFWGAVSHCENFGVSLSLSTKGPFGGTVLASYLILVAHTCFFFLLSWYLSNTRPGQYGVAKPWNFLFTRQYWFPRKVTPDTQSETDEGEETVMGRDPQYFEEMPANKPVGIKVVNVTKVFGGIMGTKNRVLTNVSLDVLKGEITVLLGHNGAGKTTLMSIITGMYSPTSGDIYVNGAHSTRQASQVRKQLGLCPQHKLFFNDLTVLEHVYFFTLLKGVPKKEAEQSSLRLLEKLNLREKRNVFLPDLSGGMQRRAQLACALAGDASVLVLDEPTSGLDVDARRELWDILLALRGDRTVLITTHFMEEADALGDRVVALHAGTVRCHATPMYLKKAIGSGYRLTMLTSGTPNEPAITAVVTRVIPDAAVQGMTINSIAYALPAKHSAEYPRMFKELESRRAELGIASIGVGVTTLEEVFLQLCRDVDIGMADDEIDSALPAPVYRRMKGPALWAHQFVALIKRQLLYTWSKKMLFFPFQVIFPIAIIFLVTKLCNNKLPTARRLDANARQLSLDMYDGVPQAMAFYDVPEAVAAGVREIARSYPDVTFRAVGDVPNDIFLRNGKSDDQNNYLVGVSLNSTHASFMFTTLVRHAAPTALNLISNLILHQRTQGPIDGITTINDPIQGRTTWALALTGQPKSMDSILTWGFIIPLLVLFMLANHVALPCKERMSGARHLHVMSGCPGVLYWLTTLVYHLCMHLVLYVLLIMIAVMTLDKDKTFDNGGFLGTLFLSMMLGVLAFCALMYAISFVLTEHKAGMWISVLIMVFGIVSPLSSIVREMTEEPGIFAKTISAAGHIFPPHSLVVATLKAGNVARLNAMCMFHKDKCPNLAIDEMGFNNTICCNSPTSTVQRYLEFGTYTPLVGIVGLILQFIVYTALVFLLESGILNRWWDRAWNRKYVPAGTRSQSPLIDAEKEHVDRAIQLPKDKITDAMLVHNLHKNYVSVCGRKTNAVKGIDFSIKPGECFGLLGANGAGKSTTFKMLTAEETPTRGRIYTNGYFLDEDKNNYLWSLGYCPQFFGLDDFLTGKQNLDLVMTLRGLSAQDVASERNSWIDVVGLQKYSNRAVSAYSGGCVRRLATAAALAARQPLTLLDEPTSGVDPAARRRVWTALRRGLSHHTAVIITSHSMDEMEALCRRIMVLVDGRVRALGTAAELRAAHAQGHAARIKLRSQHEGTDADEKDRLKAYMAEHFNCTIKDEHKTMLHYHLNETLSYSELFTRMEELKRLHPNVEDYSVTETTLEEVFLSLVKEPAADPTADPAPEAPKPAAKTQKKLA